MERKPYSSDNTTTNAKLALLIKKTMSKWSPDDVKPTTDFSIEEEIALVGIPDHKTVKTLINFANKFKTLDPNQRYYKPESLHLTLLGGLSPHLEMKKNSDNLNYILTKQPLEFELKGVSANHSGLAALAFPNFDISTLRSDIRKLVGIPDEHYRGSELFEQLGWISLLRFTKKPISKFQDIAKKNLSTHFGKMEVKKVIAVKITNTIFNEDPSTQKLLSINL